MPKVTKHQIRHITKHPELVFLDTVYERNTASKPRAFHSFDWEVSEYVSKLQDVYGIHIQKARKPKMCMGQSTQAYTISTNSIDKARGVLASFLDEVWK